MISMTYQRARTPLLTAGEAVAALGISLKTIRVWADRGELPVVRTLGGQRRFEPSAVAALRARLGFTEAGGQAE